MEMMEFFDWTVLSTFGGAVVAVAVLTQLSKEIPGVKLIPTQLWSYILALAVVIGAQAFGGGGLTWASAGLSVINAAMVSLAANGGYEAISHIKNSVANK